MSMHANLLQSPEKDFLNLDFLNSPNKSVLSQQVIWDPVNSDTCNDISSQITTTSNFEQDENSSSMNTFSWIYSDSNIFERSNEDHWNVEITTSAFEETEETQSSPTYFTPSYKCEPFENYMENKLQPSAFHPGHYSNSSFNDVENCGSVMNNSDYNPKCTSMK